MKKIIFWIFMIAIIVFAIDWGVVGIKLLDGDYDIIAQAYIGFACILIMFACAVYKIISNKCPYCGKTRLTNGEYCSYCGKKIAE